MEVELTFGITSSMELQYLKPEVDDSSIRKLWDGGAHWKMKVKKNLQDTEVAGFQSLVGMFYK